MTAADRERWDRRYRDGRYTPRTAPSPYVERWLEHVPRGAALDLACGTGRTARLLAARGFAVTAVDVSPAAIDRAVELTDPDATIEWVVADLDELDLATVGGGGPWALVTVVRYRDPGLWPRVAAALAVDGWVIVEHHLRTHREVAGPSTDDFRVAPGELVAAFRSLRVVHAEEVLEGSDHPASAGQLHATARIAAVRGSPGW